ncbi:hypothetical protein [Streptomyces sp. SS]|uniref:hypothetical protein n=1 Tax=Streptomyces sp. SS TaxID=260742 RepID=UPI000FFB4741|nr:hypothetical protein [Streptomyces sp. SS]
MRRLTSAALAAAIAALLVACGTTPEPDAPAAGRQGEPGTTASPSTRAFDVHDCKALLERGYAAGAPRDGSKDPECAHLTRDEYTAVVGEVIAGHKDEIMEDAANEVAWDSAWDQTGPEQQTVVCGRLKTDGAAVVGQEMADASDSPSGDEVEMAQYYLDEKCPQL